MNQPSKKDKQKQQNQSGGSETGMQQGANLGQKEAGREKKSDAEIKRMGEASKETD